MTAFTLKTQARLWRRVANFIERHPDRYNFNTIHVPTTVRSKQCGCLWGLAGTLLNIQRKRKFKNLFDIAKRVQGKEGGTGRLYFEMDAAFPGPLGKWGPWTNDTQKAVAGLRAYADRLEARA